MELVEGGRRCDYCRSMVGYGPRFRDADSMNMACEACAKRKGILVKRQHDGRFNPHI